MQGDIILLGLVLYLHEKRDQIHNFLRIWSHLLKKSLMENFIFLFSGYRYCTT